MAVIQLEETASHKARKRKLADSSQSQEKHSKTFAFQYFYSILFFEPSIAYDIISGVDEASFSSQAPKHSTRCYLVKPLQSLFVGRLEDKPV